MTTASTDLLDQALERVRPHLDRNCPVGERLRALWSGVVAARKFGAADIVTKEFVQLATFSGLRADLGRHADEDLEHVVRWGLLARNPFGRPSRG